MNGMNGMNRMSMGMGSTDATGAQAALDNAAAAAAKKEKDEIEAKIQKLEDNADKKIAELDKQSDLPGVTSEEKEKISTEQEAIRDDLFEKLREYHNQLTGGNTPFPITAGSALFGALEGKLRAFFGKMELKTQIADARLDLIDIITAEIKRIKENGESPDLIYLQQLSDLLSSLKKDIIPPKSPGGSPSDPAGATGAAAAAAAAAGLSSGPAAAAGAAAAAAAGLPPEAAAAVLPPEAGAAAAGLSSGPAAAAAVAEEEVSLLPNPGQEGGGISHKRSHPKYMNQVSENRNKIFKKELEIISSIRRFHRSHTIRKRDRINSILGLRKSRNNRNH